MVDNTVLAKSLHDDLPNNDCTLPSQFSYNGTLQSSSSSTKPRRAILRKAKIDVEDTVANDTIRNGHFIKCTVHFLDNTVHEFQMEKNSLGEDLLTKVFEYLELMERDIFSLQFISLLNSNTARMRWLDAKKSIKRQIVCPPYQLFFRVKFYVNDPNRLIEDYTRYLLYLQIRKDFLDDKLSNPNENFDIVFLLASFAAQAEFGDICGNDGSDSGEQSAEYLRQFKFLPTHPPQFEKRVAQFHRTHRGLAAADAEFNFCLYAAKRLLLYGFDLYNAKDGNGRLILIGVNHEGISVLDNTVIVNRFAWNVILKLSFKRKNFFLRIRKFSTPESNGNEDFYEELELSFNAICARNCKMLWKSCIEHHTFFRLPLNLCQLPSNLHNSMNSNNVSAAFRFNRLFHFRNKSRNEFAFRAVERRKNGKIQKEEEMKTDEKIAKNEEKFSNRKRCHFVEDSASSENNKKIDNKNEKNSNDKAYNSNEVDDEVTVRFKPEFSTNPSILYDKDSKLNRTLLNSDSKQNVDTVDYSKSNYAGEKSIDIIGEFSSDNIICNKSTDIYEKNNTNHLSNDHYSPNIDYCNTTMNNTQLSYSNNANKFYYDTQNYQYLNSSSTNYGQSDYSTDGYYTNSSTVSNELPRKNVNDDIWRDYFGMRAAMLNSTSSTSGISTTNDSSSSMTLLPNHNQIPSPAPQAFSGLAGMTPKLKEFEFPPNLLLQNQKLQDFQLLSNSDGNDSTTSLMSSSIVFEGEFETLGTVMQPLSTDYCHGRMSTNCNNDDDNSSYGNIAENSTKLNAELSIRSSDSEVELKVFISQNVKNLSEKHKAEIGSNVTKTFEHFENVKVDPKTSNTMSMKYSPPTEISKTRDDNGQCQLEEKLPNLRQNIRASISPSLSTASLCCTVPADPAVTVGNNQPSIRYVDDNDNHVNDKVRNDSGDNTDEDSSLFTLPYDDSALQYDDAPQCPTMQSDRFAETTAKLTPTANNNNKNYNNNNNNINADVSSVKLRRNSLVINSSHSNSSKIPPSGSTTVGNGIVANGKLASTTATATHISTAKAKNSVNLLLPPKISTIRQPQSQPQMRPQQHLNKPKSATVTQQLTRPTSVERSNNPRNSLPAATTNDAYNNAALLNASNTSSLPRPRRVPSVSVLNSPRPSPRQALPIERIPQAPPSPAKPPSKIIFVVPVTAQQLFNSNVNGAESNFDKPNPMSTIADQSLLNGQRFSISSTSSASSSASMNRRQLSPLRILPNHSPIPLKITHANANANFNLMNGNTNNNLANGQNGSQTSLVGFLLPESSLLNITNVANNANYCQMPTPLQMKLPNCCPSPSTSNGLSPSGSTSSQYSMASAQNNNNSNSKVLNKNNNMTSMKNNNENHRKLSQQDGNTRLRTAQKLTQQIRSNTMSVPNSPQPQLHQQPNVESRAKHNSKIEDPYSAATTITNGHNNREDRNQQQASTTIGDNRNNNNSFNYQSALPYSRANNKLAARPQSVLQVPLSMSPYNTASAHSQLNHKAQLPNGGDASLLRCAGSNSGTAYYRHSPLPSSSSSAQNQHYGNDENAQLIADDSVQQRNQLIQLNGNKIHETKSNLQNPPSPTKNGERTEFPVSRNRNFVTDFLPKSSMSNITNSISKPTNSIYLKRRNSTTKSAETNNNNTLKITPQTNRLSQPSSTEQQHQGENQQQLQQQQREKQQEQLLNHSLNQIIANGKKCAAVDENVNVKCSPRTMVVANGTTALVSSKETNGNANQSNAFHAIQPNNSGVKNNGANAENSASTASGLVVARIPSETFQRSNLHITGGADCVHPAIISRIAASTTIPLNEGDQVVRINGQDIAHWSHAEVTSLLQKIRENPKDTVLVIKPNVYRCGGPVADQDENEIERCATLLNETLHVADTVPRSDKLAQSMTILNRMLESNSLSILFDQVYRKKPGLSMDLAHRPENAVKNRYRDVCPYDATRVKLKNAPSGDYINANHINMEIQSSGIINRYIATQGPLPQTTADFWWMIWEHSSTTIVMLTTVMEKGRVKCHQYWPDADGKSVDFGHLQLTNVSERVEPHCCYREISIRHKVSKEERLVTQMQYTAWPDHGVPENPQHFIKFVGEVRAARKGSIEPIIVHCSAGIGRTGVLIMMETAACMIEANEPVYPLDIMRIMRDQRAMLIQTVEQFEFVCGSILRAFRENNVEPLAEYQRKRNETQRN